MATASTLLPPYTSAILPPGIWGSSLSEGFSGGTHLEDHVACKEHAHYVSSDNAVPHERAILIDMYHGLEGLVDHCLTVLAFPGSIGFPSLMSSAVWLTMEVMTRFMLIWLEKS